MHPNLKATVASGLAFFALVVPGLSDALHEAGGSEVVAAAVATLSVAVHSVVHQFTKGGDK